MEVLSKEETQQKFDELWKEVKALRWEVAWLKSQQSEWVKQDEACRLAGRSRSWFAKHRRADTLPIAMQPRTADSGTIYYLRTDCVRYAQEHRLAPPASFSLLKYEGYKIP